MFSRVRRATTSSLNSSFPILHTLKVAVPVVWWLSVAVGVVARRAPDVPVTVRVVLGLAGLFEPFVLVTGVIHDQVQDKLHSALVEHVLEGIDVGDISIWRVDCAVVADIVALP